jgi:hypothetical protein
VYICIPNHKRKFLIYLPAQKQRQIEIGFDPFEEEKEIFPVDYPVIKRFLKKVFESVCKEEIS